MDNFVIRWSGRLKWICLGFMALDLFILKWPIWAVIMGSCTAVFGYIEWDMKKW